MSTSHKEITLGVSLSVRACRQFDVNTLEVMEYAIHKLGIRRFRLMSYWNETEPEPGKYQTELLEQQLRLARENDCEVSLCLGMRQPRWPECHVPKWAKKLSVERRNNALYEQLSYIIKKFKHEPCIASYQLENEALNHGIGNCTDFDRARLRREYALVKELDPSRPIIMSTSNSWGIPLRRPIPDIVGFSFYLYQWTARGLSERFSPPWLQRLRKRVLKVMGRESFCHELQAEPWADRGTEQIPLSRQLELMNAEKIDHNIHYAIACGARTIDLWGVEWWFSLPENERFAIDQVIKRFT